MVFSGVLYSYSYLASYGDRTTPSCKVLYGRTAVSGTDVRHGAIKTLGRTIVVSYLQLRTRSGWIKERYVASCLIT